MGGSTETKSRPDAIRAFVCIEIPASVKGRIDELQRRLRATEGQASWTKASNVHLTIKFLGDIPQPKVQSINEALGRAAALVNPFEIEVGGAGCFPSPRSPRVLWVGLSEIPAELKRLHEAVEDELARLGFERERKRFSPHLTIARLRSPHTGERLARELTAAGFAAERFQANEIILMRSDLNPKGSIYTPLATIKLGAQP